MSYDSFTFPVLLLALLFAFKVLIGQSVSVVVFIRTLLELPIDIVFVSLSFIVAFILFSGPDVSAGLRYFIIYIIVAALVVFLCRRSVQTFESDRAARTIGLGVLNYLICIPGLFVSLQILSQVVPR